MTLTPAATGAAPVALGRQKAMDEASPDYLYGSEEPFAMPPLSEAEQQEEGTSRNEADGAMVAASQQGNDEGRSTQIMAATSASASGRQEALGEVGLDVTYGRVEPVVTPLSGESPVALDTSPQFPTNHYI